MKMNLVQDWQRLVVAEFCNLLNHGHSFENPPSWKSKVISRIPLTEDETDAVVACYLTHNHRFLKPIPRKWEALPNVTKDAVLLSLVDDLQSVSNDVCSGIDLTARMSRSVKVIDKRDGILDDWGIYHFHLRPTGTKHVVLAMLRGDTICAVAIREHQKWTDKSILEVIQREKEALLAPFKVDANDAATPLEESDRFDARKLGLNQPVEIGGIYYFPPGGGYTLDSNSGYAMRDRCRIIKRLHCAENVVQRHLSDNDGMEIELASIDENVIIVRDVKNDIRYTVNEHCGVLERL